jgi:hypothetical protein
LESFTQVSALKYVINIVEFLYYFYNGLYGKAILKGKEKGLQVIFFITFDCRAFSMKYGGTNHV